MPRLNAREHNEVLAGIRAIEHIILHTDNEVLEPIRAYLDTTYAVLTKLRDVSLQQSLEQSRAQAGRRSQRYKYPHG